MSQKQDKTHFGFKQVEKSEKQTLVGNVFSAVAGDYDLMNDAMSFGIHKLWKKEMMKHFPNFRGSLLDMASGTGDIANLFYEKAIESGVIAPKITSCDINFDMLKKGVLKLIDKNSPERKFSHCTANAEELPFKDASFDFYSIAFGIRNVTNINEVLQEAHRVLKVGGKFICLEFSKVENEIFSKIYDFYSFKIIPKIGKMVAKNEEAYQYLVESIKQFPNQATFSNMIENSGFKMVKHQNITGGIVAIHSAYKI